MSRCGYEYEDYAGYEDYAAYEAYEGYEDEAVAVAAAETEEFEGVARRNFASEPFQNTRLVQEYAAPRTWSEYVWYEIKYVGPFHYGPIEGTVSPADRARNARIANCVSNTNGNGNTTNRRRRRRHCCPCRCNCGCGCR